MAVSSQIWLVRCSNGWHRSLAKEFWIWAAVTAL
jgi:hypothetical protein